MAVDKLVDSTQLDADLTSVANAIRTKGGTSAQMAFPAGFVSAVEAIPTGGGGAVLIERGTFTPVENTGYGAFHIPHSLGVAPDFVVVRTNLAASASETTNRIQSSVGVKKSYNTSTQGDFVYICTTTVAGQNRSVSKSEGGGGLSINASKFLKDDYFVVPAYSASDRVAGGYTYEYVIGKVVE